MDFRSWQTEHLPVICPGESYFYGSGFVQNQPLKIKRFNNNARKSDPASQRYSSGKELQKYHNFIKNMNPIVTVMHQCVQIIRIYGI